MNRKALTLLTVLLLMLAGAQIVTLASANFFPDPGPDLSRIYIRSDGSVQPPTAPIERSGNIYRLTSDITMQTIVIQRDNIVLDGSGFSIEGNKSWMGLAPRFGDSGNNGIIIAGHNNINITNLNIERFTAGVRISGSSHIYIVENRFSEEAAVFDTPVGITIGDSSHILIESNNFTKIKGPAIACNGTTITIRGNTLTDVFDGIEGSISLKGSSNIITDNTVEGVYSSIKLGSAYSNVIARNNITGDISLLSCSQNLLQENNLKGIYITFGSNNTVYGNRLTNNSTIVEFTQTVNNTFYGNTFELNCSIRVYEVGTNFWDNGVVGNFWGNYNGSDANGDGIGDTPYIITGYTWDNQVGGDVTFAAGQDNYPLMAPYDVGSGAVVVPQDMPLLVVLAVVAAVAVAVIIGVGWQVHRRKK